MPAVPEQFSVVPFPQKIPRAILTEIASFIKIFERVTARKAWQDQVTAQCPKIARLRRPEICFFSAWDFHLPPESPGDWQLIEFNDNGSGFLFAGLINSIFYELAPASARTDIEPPPPFSTWRQQLADMVAAEARRFFGQLPGGLFLLLDDVESLQGGKFRAELKLIEDWWRQRGWPAATGSPAELDWDGRRLSFKGEEVSFVVNRSTDFFWQAAGFSPLRQAYEAGTVYIAPNPFSYGTRSDKRLLEFLSLPDWDEQLGIQPEQRIVFAGHVPETYLLREDNIAAIAARKEEFFFKPLYGFASRGVLPSWQVGQSRLRRLLKKGKPYVAQKKVPKSLLLLPDSHTSLWADLRVWAYQGEIFLLSGRASRQRELLDLTPPGGWLPTFVKIY